MGDIFPRVLLSLFTLGAGDIDNVFPIGYVQNPVARHVGVAAPANTATVVTLVGHEDNNGALEFYVKSLPKAGHLYETSPNYRNYASEPKAAPAPIAEHMLPFLVTDLLHRLVYIPPGNVLPPEGHWSSFKYSTRISTRPVFPGGTESEDGIVVLNSPENRIAGSTFSLGFDGWTVSGNLEDVQPVYQPFAWGSLSRYMYASDSVQWIDFATGFDRYKWYFEAPAAKFHREELAAGYGGTLHFTMRSLYGDFSFLNSPLDLVTLECDSCNMGGGLRIVRLTDDFLKFNGEEFEVSLTIRTGQQWKRDPLNAALPFTEATECEIAAVLHNVSRLAILGDFTQAGESVAIDNVYIASAAEQPSFPVLCQKGCICAHNVAEKRMKCCGSGPVGTVNVLT